MAAGSIPEASWEIRYSLGLKIAKQTGRFLSVQSLKYLESKPLFSPVPIIIIIHEQLLS